MPRLRLVLLHCRYSQATALVGGYGWTVPAPLRAGMSSRDSLVSVVFHLIVEIFHDS